ncbi:MAG TPA: hypothetical protein VEU47_07925, partial [Candidatus Cybelea sp.]|nr:hypothetical protein [Candidatus Cybelea sp.]
MNRRLLIAAAWAIAAAVPLVSTSPYVLHVGIMTGVFVILVQSLNLVLGYSGWLSFATPAFLGM